MKESKEIHKIKKPIVLVLIFLFVLYGVFLICTPIARPNNAVRSYVLHKIPID